jgi:hypothetical protein
MITLKITIKIIVILANSKTYIKAKLNPKLK